MVELIYSKLYPTANPLSTTEKVLGVVWNPVQEEFVYKMHLSNHLQETTKR